jgi:alpha-galactosidase
MTLTASLLNDDLIGLRSDGVGVSRLRCLAQLKGKFAPEPFLFSTGPQGQIIGKYGQNLTLDIRIEPVRPNALLFTFALSNTGSADIPLDSLSLPDLELDEAAFPKSSAVWSLQGASVAWGQDFAFELPVEYVRDNYLGHLQDAEGGGTPVNYFWNARNGLALMHIESVPQEVYMPVIAKPGYVRTSLELRRPIVLKPGQELTSPRVVISHHHGDFFAPLALYRELLSEQGVIPAAPNAECFEPAWCSWGYEFDITAHQVIGALPAVKELGIHWLTLDDRWFDTYGDWRPRADTFPDGIAELRGMNDRIHAAGCKSQIWWYPLCAEDGDGGYDSHKYVVSSVLQDHPDWVVLHEDGRIARNNRHLAMLCPALPEVREYTLALTREFISDWGFDGHKLDNIFTMPACHNPAHHHANPEESIRAFGEVYQAIFETTRKLKPDSVTQICPCGTPLTTSLISATDQTVTADPTSSAQIRQRIKFYKALMGPSAAVFADHVELSDGGVDFASEIGAGGIPATKFVYPPEESLATRLQEYWPLTPEKAVFMKKWFEIYRRHTPAKGETLNLYDLAFDTPETHVIRRGEHLYYAFFAEQFSGTLELRGLTARQYRVTDYVSGRELGRIASVSPKLESRFSGALLLLAEPLQD